MARKQHLTLGGELTQGQYTYIHTGAIHTGAIHTYTGTIHTRTIPTNPGNRDTTPYAESVVASCNHRSPSSSVPTSITHCITLPVPQWPLHASMQSVSMAAHPAVMCCLAWLVSWAAFGGPQWGERCGVG